MPISDKHKCIFIHIAKTGGMSISEALGIPFPGDGSKEKKYFAGHISEIEKSKFGLEHHVWWRHLFAFELKRFIPNDTFNNYFKFAFVRNPYDRVVSYYAKHIKGVSFDNWILSGDFLNKRTEGSALEPLMPQIDYIMDETGTPVVDFIGRYETLEKDWRKYAR